MSGVIRPLAPDPDDQLVALAVAGDIRAFERLVERHRDTVYRVAARVAGEDDADDVVQDTFLRAYHRLDRFRGDGAFRAWVLQIAHNTALSTAGRQPVGAVSLSELEDEPAAAPAGTPADQVEGRERRRRLDVKVKGLSPSTARCSSCATSRGSATTRSPTSPIRRSAA